MGAVGFIFVALLASIHGAGAASCTEYNAFGADTYLTCSDGCCGTYYSRYCCISSIDNSWTSWSSSSSSGSYSYVSSAISTGAIIGIVVGVIILIAIIVGVVLCVVCCVRASTPSPATRGVVMTSPGPQVAVVSSQAATNHAYMPPPQPQPAYPVPPPYENPTAKATF